LSFQTKIKEDVTANK